MKLQEKKLVLCSNSTTEDLKKGDELLLVINGKLTELKAKEIFYNYEQGKDYVSGHSIINLFELDNETRELKNNNIRVFFYNKRNSIPIFILKVKNTLIQRSDKNISDEEVQKTISMMREAFEAVEDKKEEQREGDSTDQIESVEVDANVVDMQINELIEAGYVEHELAGLKFFISPLKTDNVVYGLVDNEFFNLDQLESENENELLYSYKIGEKETKLKYELNERLLTILA